MFEELDLKIAATGSAPQAVQTNAPWVTIPECCPKPQQCKWTF